jgi:hypothetical protein
MRTLLLGLLVLGSLRAAEEPAPVLVMESPGPGNRYLVLVETSKEMKKQRKVAADTVSQLILNGFNGRIGPGDWVAIWTFNETVTIDSLAMRPWIPAQQATLATQAFRLVNDAKLEKSPNMAEAVEAIKDEVVKRGVLTVVLVSSGSAPLEGTPVDRRVNDLIGQNREKMRDAGKPFVIVFVTKDGRFLDNAVSPGGQAVFLPPLPKPPPPKPAVTNPPAASLTATNKPRGKSVAEIDEEIRKQTKRTNAPPAPLIGVDPVFIKPPTTEPSAAMPPTNVATVAPTSPATTNPAAAPKAEPPAVTPVVATESPPRTETMISPAAALAPSAPKSEAQTQPPPANKEAIPAPPPSLGPSPTEPNRDAAPTAAPTVVQTAAPSAEIVKPAPGAALPRSRAQSGVVMPPKPAARPNSDLLTGGLLLLAALALGWVLLRNLRPKPGASLISQSLDQGKK